MLFVIVASVSKHEKITHALLFATRTDAPTKKVEKLSDEKFESKKAKLLPFVTLIATLAVMYQARCAAEKFDCFTVHELLTSTVIDDAPLISKACELSEKSPMEAKRHCAVIQLLLL